MAGGSGSARRYPGRWLAGAAAVLLACGEDPEELTLLRQDLEQAHAVIDSLDRAALSANLTIDGLRQRADSLSAVDEDLVQQIQALSKDVRHWRDLAAAEARKAEEFRTTVERMRQERTVDQQVIARIRTEADSLYAALNQANAAIRRQSDHLQTLEQDVSSTQREVEELRQAQMTVGIYAGTEAQLHDLGYLSTSRTMGRAFHKAYAMRKRPERADPTHSVGRVGLGQTASLPGRPAAIVDRYGPLRDGRDYRLQKAGGAVTVVFVNELLAGSDVLVVLE